LANPSANVAAAASEPVASTTTTVVSFHSKVPSASGKSVGTVKAETSIHPILLPNS
jgi:hypothetical protein